MEEIEIQVEEELLEDEIEVEEENIEVIGDEGTIDIIQNGEHNVTGYATANVNVPGIIPEGTITIVSNGQTNVTNYAVADVQVPGIIPSGTLEITENGTYDVTDYEMANIDIDTSKKVIIDESASYSQSNKLMSLITEVYDIDLSKNRYTSFGSLFDSCINLRKVENLNTTGVTFAFAMFRYCQSLVDVPELDMSASTDISSMFKSCVSLSNESLNNILAMCTKAIAYTGTKNLKTIGLSSSQATICQNLSNYQAFIEAGWTTGY